MERGIKISVSAWVGLVLLCVAANWLNPPPTPAARVEQQAIHAAMAVGASWPVLWLIIVFTGGQILESAKRKADRGPRTEDSVSREDC